MPLSPARLASNRRWAAAERQRRRELGLCYDCGLPAEPGRSRCAEHLDRAAYEAFLRRRTAAAARDSADRG